MSELKPCPFCNRKVTTKKVSIPFDAGGNVKIAQCECGVFLNHTRWNTRPIEDALYAENEKLKEALSSLYEACMKADEQGELSEYVDGSILDRAQQALKEVKE